MALASTWFFDAADPNKQTLHRRITPSADQFGEQQERWNNLAETIKPALAETSGYPIRSWLQGSYKFGTQIRPVRKGDEFDIDLGIYFCWDGAPENGDYSPDVLKQVVQQALETFAADNADDVLRVDPPKPRCARIKFKGDFHIDVPCYHLDDERDQRALATEQGKWEHSDPKALYKWFTTELDDDLRERARRLVRYLKAWAALAFEERRRPASVLLTVLVARAVASLGSELPDAEDDALSDVLGWIRDQVVGRQEVVNPVDDTENLAGRMDPEDWLTFVEKVRAFAATAKSATGAGTELAACMFWAEGAFEHLFPLPPQNAIQEAAKNLPAPLTMPEIEVSAVSKDNGQLRYNGQNRIGPIPKNCTITFRVANSWQMPAGTTFRWMVRNEGVEAEDVNDLGHRQANGITATESSAYNGTHFMDCTAIHGQRVIGIRRVPVIINSLPAPKRNPPRKVYYRGR